MITVKMQNIVENLDFFTEFAKRPMKAKLAFQAARLLDAVVTEYNRFTNVKTNLVKEYGQRDENGQLMMDNNGNYLIMPEKMEECQKQLEELLNSEIQICGEPLQLSDLENQDFTPAQMYALGNFIAG